MPGPFGGLWWARKGPPTSWHQGTVSGPFRPLATVLPPHAPRPMIVGVHRRCRAPGYPWPEQMARKMLRNVEKRGVQAARNGPSEHRKAKTTTQGNSPASSRAQAWTSGPFSRGQSSSLSKRIRIAVQSSCWLILRFGGLVGKYHPKPLCGRQLWRDFGLSSGTVQ